MPHVQQPLQPWQPSLGLPSAVFERWAASPGSRGSGCPVSSPLVCSWNLKPGLTNHILTIAVIIVVSQWVSRTVQLPRPRATARGPLIGRFLATLTLHLGFQQFRTYSSPFRERLVGQYLLLSILGTRRVLKPAITRLLLDRV
jgi:hypothetical protein